MKKLSVKPIIYQIEDNDLELNKFEDQIRSNDKHQDIILNYPTVYIHNWKHAEEYEVYIGESNNIIQRTKQHYVDAKKNENWQNHIFRNKGSLYIIGHDILTNH